MKVLVVEDDKAKRTAIIEALVSTGRCKRAECQHAKDVGEASRRCSKTTFDLVVLDVRLPITNGTSAVSDGGIRFLHNLRQQKALNRPHRLVGLTAFSEAFDQYRTAFESDCYTLIRYDPTSSEWASRLATAVAQAMDAQKRSGGSRFGRRIPVPRSLDVVVVVVGLLVAVAAAFFPVGLTPTSRTVVFALCACLCGIVFGSKANSRFTMNLPGLCFTTAGAAAVLFGSMVMLHHLTARKLSIGVYQIRSSVGTPAFVQQESVIVETGANGTAAGVFIRGSEMLIVFPSDEECVVVRMEDREGKEGFAGPVLYTPGVVQELALTAVTNAMQGIR